MTVFATIAFATFLLEHDYLVAFYKRGKYFTHYFCAFYGGGANLNVTISVSEENAVEFNLVTFFNGFAEIMNIQELFGLSLELLSLDFYDCVHLFELYVVRLLRKAAELNSSNTF